MSSNVTSLRPHACPGCIQCQYACMNILNVLQQLQGPQILDHNAVQKLLKCLTNVKRTQCTSALHCISRSSFRESSAAHNLKLRHQYVHNYDICCLLFSVPLVRIMNGADITSLCGQLLSFGYQTRVLASKHQHFPA